MKEVATIPHLKSIELLSFPKTEHIGPVSKSRTTQRLVGLTTDKVLPEMAELHKLGWKEEWGDPIRINDLEATRLNIHLKYADKVSDIDWNPTLADVHNFTPIPEAIAEAWRKDLNKWTRLPWSIAKLQNIFTGNKDNPLQLVGTLNLPDGSQIELGSFAEGSPVRTLLRGGIIAKWMDKPMRRIKAWRGKPIEKNLPHASIRVVPTAQKTCKLMFQSLLGQVTFSP